MTTSVPRKRRRCPKCGAMLLQKTCHRCTMAPDAAAKAELDMIMAKHRAEVASRPFRKPIIGALRGQPGAQHRRGGVPYSKELTWMDDRPGLSANE